MRGPKDVRVIALTYDDGPNPPYTDQILEVLRAEHVHATFFVVGRAVAAYPSVVRDEVAAGNAVGNHTWNHAHLLLYDGNSLRRTLQRTDAAIFAAAEVHTRIMRPPYGARDWLVLDEVRKLGYTPVMWSVPLANDWEYPPARVIAARVLRYAGDGAIIDLHDGNQGIVCARYACFFARLRPQRRRRGDAPHRRSAQKAKATGSSRFRSCFVCNRMRLCVQFPAKTDEAVGVMVSGIVMRPMHDRQLAPGS